MNAETVLALLFEVDPSAALFRDGALVALGEEERFTRKKHAPHEFPTESVRYVLKEGSLALSDVDCIAYGWNSEKYPLEMAEKFLRTSSKFDKNQKTIQWEINELRKRNPEVVEQTIQAGLQEFSSEIPQIQHIDHHKAHAVSAYSYSGFDSAAILTVDGYGEQNAATGWKATNDGFEQVFSIEIPNSLGWYMFSLTTFLGFRANNGEGKVMGLAPYGKPDPEIKNTLENVLTLTDAGYSVDPSYIYYGEHNYHERFTDKFVEELGRSPREYGEKISQFYKNLAFEGQLLLEKALLSISRRLLSDTDMNRLCLAGGVAMNCKANMRLRDELDIKDIFIQPVAGDNGVPMGAGIIATKSFENHESTQMKNPYYGFQASPERITDAIDSYSVESIAEGRTNVRNRFVSELIDGKIIARYSGRMECGPRALGNRSIIADPSDGDNLMAVNDVKQREEWRPFAPTVLADGAQDLLVGENFDPFMIQTYEVTPEGRDKIEAAIHVDNTTRPQVLKKGANESYWKLINEFDERTGVPAVLNTSFNLSGDPIVRTPEEAIQTFLKSNIDYLQIEQFLLARQS